MLGKPSSRVRRGLFVAGVALALAGVCGCRTLSFYGQAIHGQCALLAHQRRVDRILADPQTPVALRQRLQIVQNLRAFAQSKLHLPVDGNYQKYVDVHRRFVVWNVEAAPEFSLQAKTWWYPFLGRLSYRGYFSETAAQDYARALARQGLEVSVGGVPAYSTLGWFKDPLLNTFLFEPEEELAETIFHELAHQRLFIAGDTDFNEAFATTVGEEGARRWLKTKGDEAASTAYQASVQRAREFAALLMTTHHRLEDLYGDERLDDGSIRATARKQTVPRDQLRQQKQALLDQLQRDYAALRARWSGNDEYDAWFARQINNARLNSVATYYDLVPGFERLLEANGGDLEKFYQAVDHLSKLPRTGRAEQLRGSPARPTAQLPANSPYGAH